MHLELLDKDEQNKYFGENKEKQTERTYKLSE